MKQLHYCPLCGIVTMTDGSKRCNGVIMKHGHLPIMTRPVPITHVDKEEKDQVPIV